MKSDTFIFCYMVAMSLAILVLIVISYKSRQLIKSKYSHKEYIKKSIILTLIAFSCVILYSFFNSGLSYVPPVSNGQNIENEKTISVFIRTLYDNNVFIREEILNDKNILSGSLSSDLINFPGEENSYYASHYNVALNNIVPISNTPAKLFNMMLSVLLGFSFSYFISNLIYSIPSARAKINKTNLYIIVFIYFIIIVVAFLFPAFLNDDSMGFMVDYFPELIAVIISSFISLCITKIFDIIDPDDYSLINERINCFLIKSNELIYGTVINKKDKRKLIFINYLLLSINNEIRGFKTICDNLIVVESFYAKDEFERTKNENKNNNVKTEVLDFKIKTKCLNKNKNKKADINERIKNSIEEVNKMKDKIHQIKGKREKTINILIDELDWFVEKFEFRLKELSNDNKKTT
ncbi:hypothetical protein ABC081_009570 [Providencia rettgeri]